MANSKCKECGCSCKNCVIKDHDVHLHVEIENLKQKLVERESHIVTMETNFLNEANKFPNGELVSLREELLTWQDKYRRLYDAHRRVQRVNQGLEDKLLKLVDVCETDKNSLTKDVATLSHRLAEANYAIRKLTEDNEQYKKDVYLAIQFLQCKQSNFVAHKFDSLAPEVQTQVASFMINKRKPEERKIEMKSIKVPIPTFPPTAMVYSVPKSPKPDRNIIEPEIEQPQVDIVSAAIMAKVLEERQKDRAFAKHCDTCSCSKKLKITYDISHHTIGTQTTDDSNNISLCLRCSNDPVEASQTAPVRLLCKNESVVVNKKLSNEAQETVAINGNIVKVQSNNFLTGDNTDNYQLLNNEIKSLENSKSLQLDGRVEHHRLCSKSSPSYEVDCSKDSDNNSAKNSSSENLKGPRYCSMRVQTGTRNILLDNAHNNIAPVLYTRHKKVEENLKSLADSYSSDDKNNSFSSETSIRNQQRVADWIQSNLGQEVSSSENSQADSMKGEININKLKYAEMEEHVKRFLFGESEFLKTVEIGKLKYQNFQEKDQKLETNSNQDSSHAETEI